jgi:hypothetical protein
MIPICAVCSHPDRVIIETRITSGEPLKDILIDYPVALYAHKVDCMEGNDWGSEKYHWTEDPHPEDYSNPFDMDYPETLDGWGSKDDYDLSEPYSRISVFRAEFHSDIPKDRFWEWFGKAFDSEINWRAAKQLESVRSWVEQATRW